MSNLGWAAALLWWSIGSGVTLIVIGTRKRSKRRNKRVGLPAPQCQRFPAYETTTSAFTRRQAE